jgi:glycine/D-amino acid oxidase-like deaminating enzyme
VDSADVVVIGGGVTGLSSAFWLARAGADVVVVEKGLVGWEASGRNGGLVSQKGDTPAEVALAKETCRLWPTMDAELGYPTEWVAKGRLRVALDETRVDFLRWALAEHARAGVEAGWLTAGEVRALVPCITERALGGLYTPLGGHANPQRTAQAFAWAILDRGGRIYPQTSVTGIRMAAGKVTAVDTTRGPIATPVAVSCAGPQTGHVGRMVGVEIPVAPARVEIIATLPVDPLFDVGLSAPSLYGRQTRRGNVIFGGGPHEWTDVASTGEPAKPSTPLVRSIARRLAELLPPLAEVPVLRAWAGVVEQTPDYSPILDRLESPAGFVVATASGHGFGLCPAVGKVVSELVTKGASSIPVEGLRLSRFAGLAADWRRTRQWVAGAYNT